MEKTINSLIESRAKGLCLGQNSKEEVYRRFCTRFTIFLGYLYSELSKFEEDICNNRISYDGCSYQLGTDEFLINYQAKFNAQYGLSLYQPWYQFKDIFYDLATLIGQDGPSELTERKFVELLKQCLAQIGFDMKIEIFQGTYIIDVDPACRLKKYKEQFFADARRYMREQFGPNSVGGTMVSGQEALSEYVMMKRKENSYSFSKQS